MSSILDINLITIYKKMMGLFGITVVNTDTTIHNNVTTDFLNVLNKT